MQTRNDKAERGHRVSYLTPAKRPPALLTAVTKPDDVKVNKLSPLFSSSPGSLQPVGGLHLTDICRSALANVQRHETHEELTHNTIIPSAYKSTSNIKLKNNLQNSTKPQRNKKESPLYEIQPEHSNFIHQIESQIIPSKSLMVDHAAFSLTSNSFSDRMEPISIKTVSSTQHQLEHSDRQQSYSVSPSMCSSYSGDESLTGLSRSSLCDGCSSTDSVNASNGLNSSTVPNFPYTNVVDDDSGCNVCTFHRHSQDDLNQLVEDLFDSHTLVDKPDGPVFPVQDHMARSNNTETESETCQLPNRNCMKKLSLNNEQLMFLLLRLILSKYKALMLSVNEDQRVRRSERLTIACLIQAVMVLAKRGHSSNQHWHKMQSELRLVQMKYEQLRKSQRKVYMLVCFVFLINLMQIPPVRRRVISCFRFFGIVETIKKINRTRRMIADNWRNIPLLLTDFWRIFIFRTNIKRNVSV